MARAVYLSSLEPESGKSLVALGLMEILSRRVDRVGYFRPVVRPGQGRDETIELFRSRYRLAQSYDESFGVTADRTRSLGTGTGGNDAGTAVVDDVLGRFEALSKSCDVVVVEGTDYQGASAAFQVDLNARMAANLGAGVVVVAAARERRPDQVRGALEAARATFAGHGSPVVANVVNRVPQDLLEQFNAECRGGAVPTWVLPEIPGLDRPTLGEIVKALDAEVLVGDASRLTREVAATRVAAMTVSHMLEYLQPDSLVVVPGDRADVILTCLTTRFTSAFPAPAGLLLTGGMRPDPQVLRFAEGLDQPITPMLLVPDDTYATASALADVHPQITAGAERKIALALGTFERLVDTEAIARRLEVVESRALTPLMFEHRLLDRARADRRHIVLPEGDDDRVLQAAERLLRRDIVELTILGDPTTVADRARVLGLDLAGADVLDHRTAELRHTLAAELSHLRRSKGLALDAAYDLLSDVSYFGTMMVQLGLVDGMVSGATHTTAHTVRPALQVIRTQPGVSIVSSVFFMALPDRVLVYGDCAINPDPDAEQLADIAISSAATAAAFGIEPKVAMLSYSTGVSGSGADVDKVRAATDIVRRRAPALLVEGPIQYDAAVDPAVAVAKLPGSDVAGHATVLIFPDLNTGNNTYKAVQRSAGAIAIGPVLQGLRKPVNDLSRGALVEDIVSTVVITAIQAQQVAAAGEAH